MTSTSNSYKYYINDTVIIKRVDPNDSTFDANFEGMVGIVKEISLPNKYPVTVQLIGEHRKYMEDVYGQTVYDFQFAELEPYNSVELEEDLYI